MSTKADRIAFGRCPETCPAVDRAFKDASYDLRQSLDEGVFSEVDKSLEWLCARVKEVGTEKLRSALVELADDYLESQSRCDDLQQQVDRMEVEISELKAELREANEASA